jgi:hypothetical protein
MHTVELLNEALEIARQAGYKIRQEWLDECSAGACMVRGQKLLFLDPMQSTIDQLEQVLDVLREDPAARQLAAASKLGELRSGRHAA